MRMAESCLIPDFFDSFDKMAPSVWRNRDKFLSANSFKDCIPAFLFWASWSRAISKS